MHALGVEHVERNGHHYFRGLSVFGQDLNEEVLNRHGDLYHRHPDGFAALSIQEGNLAMGSVASAPFGTAFAIDEWLDPWLPMDDWTERGAFADF